MRNMKKTLALLISLAMTAMAFAACGSGDTAASPSGSASASAGSAAKSGGKVSVVGSTSVTPLMEELADAYKTKAGVTAEIQGVGSSAGIKAASDGTAQIGMSSRELKEEEKAGLTETVIAKDGIAVIVNPANTVTNLTQEQIAGIFKGEITNWSEVGGPDKKIVVVSREDGSGTRSAFEEIVKLTKTVNDKEVSALATDAIIASSNGEVESNVSTKENAIGYMSLGMVKDSVKAVDVDGIKASVENIKNGTYGIQRPFILVTKGEGDADSKAMIDFILSDEGQQIVSQDYITVK